MGTHSRDSNSTRAILVGSLHRIKHSSPKTGFSLVELLIAILTSSIIAIAASSVLLDNIRITSRQDSILRLQENWNRIQFLIDQDLSEGSGSCFTGSSSLAIYRYDAATNANQSYITYSLVNGSLERNGPTINANGMLVQGTSSNDIVTNHVIEFAEDNSAGACTAANPSQKINYTLGLREVRDGRTLAQYTNQGNASSGYSRVDPIN